MKLIEKTLAFFAWIQILISPLTIGLIAGLFIWLYFKTTFGLVCAIIVATLGLFMGIRLAEKARRDKGTVDFMSRVNASPDLDKLEDVNELK